MISVDQALEKITDLLTPLAIETVPLGQAAGRVLAKNVSAKRSQPPFRASSMDGYAVKKPDKMLNATFTVIGESAAGSGFAGQVHQGEAVRIFTGAPVPEGADHVVIQENVTRAGNVITINDGDNISCYIRPLGDDFNVGDTIIAPRMLDSGLISLLASMNIDEVPVRKRPIVALVATGNELVMPGETPGNDQIIASNNFGLAALLAAAGAEPRMLPIARDTSESLRFVLGLCKGADLIVTIGGASVGDHDIVRDVATEMGLETAFYKVAMRPGKPLMAGRLMGVPMVGLPGNPVSSMVCGHVFLRPALAKMQGLEGRALARESLALAVRLGKNGAREHYMRARIELKNGVRAVHPEARQDSALLTVLANANALLVRAPNDPPKNVGDMVDVIRL